MADPHHTPVLDGFDRLTVRLYRTGLMIAAAGVAGLAVLLGVGADLGPALAVILAGALLSVLDMHLYDKRIRSIIAGSAQVGAVGLLAGAWWQVPLVAYAGLGFVFVTLSGFALKEQFCFKIPGLRLVPLFLAAGLVPLSFGVPRVAAVLFGLACLPLAVLSVAKWRMPLHFDVGDKSRYQNLMATETREKLLEAVESVLDEEGLGKLSLRRVGKVAGVSHAAPGVVFGDKAGLLTAFATRGFRAMGKRMAAALNQPSGPETLSAVGQAYVQFALEHPGMFEVMFRRDLLDGDDDGYRAATRAASKPLAQAFDQLVEEGVVPPEQVEQTKLAAWSIVHGLVMLRQSGQLGGHAGVEDTSALAGQLTRLFAGLLATAASVRDSPSLV